ncbi:Enolase C-terminal [Penicillium expansum]|nr:Enolase C-terminal [Penicillium expansum]
MIRSIQAAQRLDSRGHPTVQVDLTTDKGKRAPTVTKLTSYTDADTFRAIVPSGASTGANEAIELRDGDNSAYGGKGVQKAVSNIGLVIGPALVQSGLKVDTHQKMIDDFLKNLDGTDNKSKLGANAILGVSMACVRAGAAHSGVPLYEFLRRESGAKKPFVMPVPFFNVLNGGVHSGNKMAFQETMIAPVGASSFTEAVQMGSEVYQQLKKVIVEKFGTSATGIGDEGGFTPPISQPHEALDLLVEAVYRAGYTDRIKFAIDPASSEFFRGGKYDIGFKDDKPNPQSSQQLAELYRSLLQNYPIVLLEDPFAETDWDSWTEFNKKCPVELVGDDLLVTNTRNVQEANAKRACNSMLLKINQIGTISEAIEAYALTWYQQQYVHTGQTASPRGCAGPPPRAVRDILRVCLGAKEYRFLHESVIKRAPAVQSKLPSPSRYDAIARPNNRHSEAAIRSSLRVLVGSGIALKLADLLMTRFQGAPQKKTRTSLLRSPKFRLSISLSLLLLIHRLLYRFLIRLRANLRTDDAKPFRERNPRISRALTSRFAPAIGASLAGFALGICPQDQLRLTAAIYTGTRSLEFFFNVLDSEGWLDKRPWWFGSWLLMPISFAQLFHAFVFDRETTPNWFPKVILKLSPSYIQGRPESLPDNIAWPEKEEIVNSLASIADLRWPAFVSPILHPGDPNTLPSSVASIFPITGPAHPAISSLSCALLHPNLPNCSTAFLHHILLSVPLLARFLTTVTLALSIPKFKSILLQPISSVNTISKRIITMTAVLSAAIGTAWGSVCLLNNNLPRTTLPTKRFFLSGALGGLPFLFLGNSRSTFLWFFRAAVDSAYKTGVKRGLWKGRKGGELLLFVLSWALMGSILEGNPEAVQGGGLRKALAWLRGDGFADPVDIAKRKLRRESKKPEGNEVTSQ